MKKILSLLFVVFAFSQCSSIQYEADIGFLNSAQANSMEWMVQVDNLICKDMEGMIGACTKRTKSDHSPILKHDPRPYAYRIDVRCTEATGIGFSMDVEAEKEWSYEVDAENFKTLRSFTCQGEIFPHDRDNKLSALWQIRFIVVDKDYKEREIIYFDVDDGKLIVGKHALHTRLCRDGKCEDYKEDTVIDAQKNTKAYSESEVMRFNYFGYND